MDQRQKEKINDLFLCYLEQKRERGEMQKIYYGQLMTQVPKEPEFLETWMHLVTQYAPRFTMDEVSLIEKVLKYDYKGMYKCIDAYDSMLKALVVAGEAFIPLIFKHLFSLIAPLPEEDQEPTSSSHPSLVSLDFQELTPEWIAEHCTHIIIEIARNYPSYTPHLIKPLKKFFPHKSFSEQAHQLYVESILLISEAFEGVRDTIIALVVNKMLAVDIDIQLDLAEEEEEETSMFDVEMEASPLDKSLPLEDQAKRTQVLLASNLDTMMYQILQYIDRICKRAPQEREKVFNLLLRVFEKSILHSIKCKFTQYLLFYICKYDYSTQFLSYLMNTAFDSLKPPITRQLCFAYASSFCSRSNYTPIPQTLYCLNLISQWCCAYIKNQTGQIVVSDSDEAFFAAVQAILYTLCFRMEPMVDFLRSTSGDPSVSSLSVINSLELRFILSSSYNPSQGCNQSVVREFCKFMSDQHIDEIADLINQQLLSRDSYSVLRRQKQTHTEMQLNPGAHRNDRQSAHEYQALLSSTNVNSFFPFDPFLLKHSSAFIDPLYIKWNRSFSFGEEAFEDSGTEDADDHFSSSFECDSDLSSSYGDGMMSFTPEFSYNFGLELAKRRQ